MECCENWETCYPYTDKNGLPNWATLPDVALRLSFASLTCLDRLAANQVCRSWRAAMSFVDLRVSLQFGNHFTQSRHLTKFLACLNLASQRPGSADDLRWSVVSFEAFLPNDRHKTTHEYPRFIITREFLTALHATSSTTLTLLDIGQMVLEEDAEILSLVLFGFSVLGTLKCFAEKALTLHRDQARALPPHLTTLHCNYSCAKYVFSPNLRELSVCAANIPSLRLLFSKFRHLETLIVDRVVAYIVEGQPITAPCLKRFEYKGRNGEFLWNEGMPSLFLCTPNLETFVWTYDHYDATLNWLGYGPNYFVPKLKEFDFTAEPLRFIDECISFMRRFETDSLTTLKLRFSLFEVANELVQAIAAIFPNLTSLELVAFGGLSQYLSDDQQKTLSGQSLTLLCERCSKLHTAVFKGLSFGLEAYTALAFLPENVRRIQFTYMTSDLYGRLLLEVLKASASRTNLLNLVHEWYRFDPQGNAQPNELMKYGFILENPKT